MRFAFRSTIAFLACWLSLTVQNRLAIGQDNATGSTIRLTSATEPVREETVAPPPPQESAPDSDDAPPALTGSLVRAAEQSSAAPTPVSERPAAERPPVRRPRMPAGLYASPSAKETLAQMPRRMPVQPTPQMPQSRRMGKPFQSIPMQPTLSPYLNLNAGAGNASPIANYLTLGRPQAEQLEFSRQQQQAIDELRMQVQQLSAASAGPQRAASRNSAPHYMNTGQFYRGLQR